MVIKPLHEEHFHYGQQALLSIIRQQFWPIGVKNTIKQIIHKCIVCFRANPKSLEQLMGNLPAARVQTTYPFFHTGVDFCGPMLIKSGGVRSTKTIKAYIALFVCMATKAIHVEVVSDLSSNAFVAAIHRFISRRGKVKAFYSDNATNFVGTKRHLDELYKLIQSKEYNDVVKQCCNENGIEWHFIPPRAPNFGGLWEAAVKSLKYHLKRIIGQSHLTFEELYTVLVRIKGVLNSRPLFPESNDPNDFRAITPDHFLIGRPITDMIEEDVIDIPLNRLSRWQRLKQLNQHFWSRWSNDYLHCLQQRTASKKCKKNVEVGSLVLMKEENVPSMRWLMGRITHTYPGPDGLVRVVSIKTINGELKRAIGKVCLLPIDT